MKQQTIQMRREVIVKLTICIFLLVGSIGCKSSKIDDDFNDDKLVYELINSIGYSNGVLNRMTLSYNELSQKNLLSINEISDRNYKNNWVLENEPHVDFDTIFNTNQKNRINENFKKLEKVRLNANKLRNPKAISKDGQTHITFPFLQEGENGSLYGFFLQLSSPESTLFIFIKIKDCWKEFAKVAMGIS